MRRLILGPLAVCLLTACLAVIPTSSEARADEEPAYAGTWKLTALLGTDEMVLVASPALVAAHGQPQALENVARMPTLSMAGRSIPAGSPDHHIRSGSVAGPWPVK